MHNPDDDIYPGGYRRLMRFLEKRQVPFDGVVDLLPSPDVDLEALKTQVVAPPEKHMDEAPRFSAERKWLELQAEWEGGSQLHLLYAMLIAVSRRQSPPRIALDLFFRIWREQGHHMAQSLSVRWLISSATTFADCGETADQRALGMGLSTLFDSIKLHDSERRASGIAGDTLSPQVPRRKRSALAFDMWPYAMARGDLDMVLLARLWALAETDSTIRPLAMRLLRMLMSDRRSVFGRMQRFKSENSS